MGSTVQTMGPWYGALIRNQHIATIYEVPNKGPLLLARTKQRKQAQGPAEGPIPGTSAPLEPSFQNYVQLNPPRKAWHAVTPFSTIDYAP